MNTDVLPSREVAATHKAYAGLIGVLIVVGFWLRVRNLGELSLFVDEGVEALAIRAILENGIPQMESGLIYLRFPLFLYLQAAFAHLFELNEFWLRFPSVIFGVAAIIPTYFLGKTLINRPMGALAAGIITISAWQVELSRYGRPYIALQFFFLVALIYLYRGFMLDEDRYKAYFVLAAFCAFLTHELSQVLAVAFLIPLVYPGLPVRKRLWFSVWGIAFGGIMIVVRKLSTFYLPDGLSYADSGGSGAASTADRITSAIGIPSLHGPEMSYFAQVMQQQSFIVPALLVVGGLAMGYLVYRSFKHKRPWRGLLALLMIWAAFIYQFALVSLFFVSYLAIFARDLRILQDRILIASTTAVAACFGIWSVALALSPELVLMEVPLLLFSFPDVYKYLLRWLVKGWPVLAMGLAGGSVWLFVRFIKDRTDAAALFLLGALYVPALFASLFESSFVPVYTLHLFPIVVLIFVVAVWGIGTFAQSYFEAITVSPTCVAVLVAVPALLVASPDTRLMAAWNVTERTYQSEKSPIRNIMTFRVYSDFHPDYKGPALYVREHRIEDDIVAVIGMDHATQLYDYYSGGVDYAISTSKNVEQYGVTRGDTLVHYTTGYEYITSSDDLRELIRMHRGRLWLLGDRRILRAGYPLESAEPLKKILRHLAREPEFTGRDEVTFAVKVH